MTRSRRTHGLLLDTHVFLWWFHDDPKLGEAARERVATAPLVYVSAASAWEVSIKVAMGRIHLPAPFVEGVQASDFEELPVRFSHAKETEALPPLHGDPFDRLLVAQARAERLTLVTADRKMEGYDVDLLLV
jgi:PIN domain nuclease of toxin-antitoxin system